jgi:archaellum component FlaG (FlaF/FlaG flagellin family)
MKGFTLVATYFSKSVAHEAGKKCKKLNVHYKIVELPEKHYHNTGRKWGLYCKNTDSAVRDYRI